MGVSSEKPIYTFGAYRIDVRQRRVYCGGRTVTVTSKAFDVLVELVGRGGEVVSKDELMAAAWADTAVEENNLTQQISALRKIFGKHAGENRFIVTVPGRGYCFVSPVRQEASEVTSELVVKGSTKSSITIDLFGVREHRLFQRLRFDRGPLLGAGLGAAYVLVVCLTVMIFEGRNHFHSVSTRRSVGVLTFKSVGVDDDRLGVGIRETLRAKLGSLDDISVYPGSIEPPGHDTLAAGEQMNVDVVLAGSIQQEQGRIRVAVEMVDVRSKRIVWGSTFDEMTTNTFELQDSIAAAVAERLKVPRLNSRIVDRFDRRTNEIVEAALDGPFGCRKRPLAA